MVEKYTIKTIKCILRWNWSIYCLCNLLCVQRIGAPTMCLRKQRIHTKILEKAPNKELSLSSFEGSLTLEESFNNKKSAWKQKQLEEQSWAAMTWSNCCLYVSRGFGVILVHSSLELIEIYRHSFMHNSVKIPPQHLNQAEVWTLTGALQQLDSFLLYPFFCRFAVLFGVIVLLHDLISAKL